MPKLKRGDTLIEVLIAFSILSFVMATAFNGAIYGYKTAKASQERTQASLAVQYQIEALKTYRNSMAWSGDPSFLEGSTVSLANYQSMSNLTTGFCMIKNTTDNWAVNTISDLCNTTLAGIAPNLAGRNQTMTIVLTNPTDLPIANTTPTLTYTVTVSWRPSNSSDLNYLESSTGVVVLTKN